MFEPAREASGLSRILLPALAAACAIAISIFDTVTELEIAVAVLYVAVVLMAVSFCSTRGVLLVTFGCMVLTVTSYFLSPNVGLRVTAVSNALLSIAAIGVTAFLAVKNQSAIVALHQARAQLAHVARLTALGELTASIAHEINQPLTGVVSNANAATRWLAAQAPDVSEARLALERIVEDGMRASRVVARVRALARKLPLQKDWLNLNDPILDVAALIRGEVQQKGITLTLQLAPGLPPVLGDRVLLQQVILNLTMNAVEAMTAARSEPPSLVISSARDADGIVVAVRDSGPGLDPRTLDQLFEAFYTTKTDGMGIGLAVSRTIIETHQGRLWATPNQPRGAVFQFRLPASTEGQRG
jgi:signal transduction histidine kinase